MIRHVVPVIHYHLLVELLTFLISYRAYWKVAVAIMNSLSVPETSNGRDDSATGNKSLNTTSKFALRCCYSKPCKVASENLTSSSVCDTYLSSLYRRS